MKKAIYIMTLLLFYTMSVSAQAAGGKVGITNLKTVETNGEVFISFDAKVAGNAVSRNTAHLLTPVLTGEGYRVELPEIIIEGRGSRTAMIRREWASGEALYSPDAFYAKNGETIHYSAKVQAQQWMQGGALQMEGVTAGCCSYTKEPAAVLASELHLYDVPMMEVVTEIRRFKPQTVADSLSVMFPFVLPETMFDPEDPYKIYDEERSNSLIVFFRLSKSDIDRSYMDNARTLTNLVAAIEMILGESASKVEKVVVAGFASPEGTLEFNEQLAFDRAMAVKRYLVSNTALRDPQVWIHNGSVDWRGLRLLVAGSDMADRDRILSIIDSIPAGDEAGKTQFSQLRRLNDGKPYEYMLKNFFPLLRNGAFIKVYYSNN